MIFTSVEVFTCFNCTTMLLKSHEVIDLEGYLLINALNAILFSVLMTTRYQHLGKLSH